MKTIKGPAIFLAQFMGDNPPFDNLKSICKWAASLGYVGVQIPAWDARCIDLKKAAESKDYCDELKGTVESCGLQVTELSTHLQGSLSLCIQPITNVRRVCAEGLHGKPKERTMGC
jgi:sugar phosphate isomerase/epimerase